MPLIALKPYEVLIKTWSEIRVIVPACYATGRFRRFADYKMNHGLVAEVWIDRKAPGADRAIEKLELARIEASDIIGQYRKDKMR